MVMRFSNEKYTPSKWEVRFFTACFWLFIAGLALFVISSYPPEALP